MVNQKGCGNQNCITILISAQYYPYTKDIVRYYQQKFIEKLKKSVEYNGKVENIPNSIVR